MEIDTKAMMKQVNENADAMTVWSDERRKDFGPKQKILAGWGTDNTALTKQISEYNLPNPFSEHYLDIQLLFRITYNINKNVSLLTALSKYGMEFVGRQHSAKDDAVNAAKILRQIITKG